jgi:general secretion pathway protein D
MRKTTVNFLLSIGLLASLWVAAGCGSEETISDRKRRAHAELKPEEGPEEGPEESSEKAAAAVAADEDSPEGAGEAQQGEMEGEEASPAPEDTSGSRQTRAAPEEAAKAKPSSKKAAAAPASRGKGVAAGRGRDEGILDDLRGEKSRRKEEAKFNASKGDEYFQQSRYDEAVKWYRKALDLDPSLDAARKRMNDALILLGERSGEVPAIAEDMRNQVRVKREQEKMEIARKLKEGEQALEENNVDRAESLVSQAVDSINLDPDFDPAGKAAAQALLKRVRAQKEERKKERDLAQREVANEKAEEELEEEAKVKHNQVQELLRKSSQFLRIHDYEKTVDACERALKIDPDNRVAKFWLADAKEQLLRQRRQRLVDQRVESRKVGDEKFLEATIAYPSHFVFPDDPTWEIARNRSKSLNLISVEDPEPVRRIKNALEGTIVKEFSFDKTPLDDVVQQIRTFTGANIAVDPQVDGKTLNVTMKIDSLPASNALNLILDSVGLTYTFKENILFITNPGQQSGRTEFGIYNVSDLLNKIRDFEGPELILKPQGETGQSPISFTSAAGEEEPTLDAEQLVQLVKESTGGETAWAEPNSIEHHEGQFLVNATRELHAKIQDVLSNLRKDSDLFVVIEARFIDITDDFLEDIGIDSRALGAVNNWGTPFGNVINDNRTGGQDIGFVRQGSPVRDVTLIMGQDRWAGRIRHIIDGFTGTVRSQRGLTAGSGIGGLTFQGTWLEPFQINVILRAVQERSDVRQLTAPVVTAHNGQRVFASVITQRAYIADYNLVSGGTGFAIIEVADPEVQTFQEGVILDVDPVVSHDKKYITLDVRPTLATLRNGIISTILISLGSFTNVAFMVPIGIPQISLQQSFTSVTVPNGGTVLLGGFKSLNEAKYTSYLPIIGRIPLIGNLFRRKATLSEKRSLVILLSARIVDLRGEEGRKFNE